MERARPSGPGRGSRAGETSPLLGQDARNHQPRVDWDRAASSAEKSFSRGGGRGEPQSRIRHTAKKASLNFV